MATPPDSDERTRPAFATYPSLKGKPVLITGGASGIGAEMVRAFAEQGVEGRVRRFR